MLLSWVVLGRLTGEIKQFHIRQVGSKKPEILTTATHYLVTGLTPATPYKFEVAVENTNGEIGDYDLISDETGMYSYKPLF